MSVPEWASREAARLDGAPALAPRTRAGCIEVVHVLARHCTDAQHARRVISTVLDSVQRCQNLVAELVRIASETKKRPELPSGCSACNGEPWIMVDGLATRCKCARGQALKALSLRSSQEQRGVATTADYKSRGAGDWED